MGRSTRPSQRWLRRAATGSLAVIMAFAALVAPRFSLPLARAAGTTVTVDSYGDWVDTGVSVTSGEMLSISASGSWTPGAPSDQYYGPDGSSTWYPDNYLNLSDIGCGDPSCATTNAPHWAALIGYIGSNPPYPGSYADGGVQADAQRVFFVGSAFNQSAGYSGELWLNFNDDAYSGNTTDNDGSVNATIQVSGSGPTTCGTTLGQQCDAIWTDKSSYHVGDTITYCYSVQQPAYVQITDVEADGTSQVVLAGNDDGTGGCQQGTITPPAGTEHLYMDVQGNGWSDSVSTSFQVLQAACTAIPGGLWISPQNGSTTSGDLTFAAHAYEGSTCEGGIKYVNFTVWWPGLGPQSGPWKIACTETSPETGDEYGCDVNLAALGAPAGTVWISFDVYDNAGNKNLAPNGEHTITYQPPVQPPPATPTPTPTSPPPTNTPVPPTPTPTPQPVVPTPTPQPKKPKATVKRYIMFVPGVCFSVLEIGPCARSSNGEIDANWRAWTTFQTVIGQLDPWAHKHHVTYEYYSYAPGHYYYPSDTHQTLDTSAFELDEQLRALIPSKKTKAEVDLIGHSLGGVVIAYWATQVGTFGDTWMLKKVHAAITMDSPVQGNAYALGNLTPGVSLLGILTDVFTGTAGSQLDPWSGKIGSITNASSGTTRVLPDRFHTIGNDADLVVLQSESWLQNAYDNKSIDTCWDTAQNSQDATEGCHGAVLSSAKAVDYAVGWIEGG